METAVFESIKLYNPNHDAKGRFATGSGAVTTVARGQGRTIRGAGGKRVSNTKGTGEMGKRGAGTTSSELKPIRRIDVLVNPAAPPNPHFLKALYGQDQLTTALKGYTVERLRQSAEKFGISVPRSASKARLVSRIVAHMGAISEQQALSNALAQARSNGGWLSESQVGTMITTIKRPWPYIDLRSIRLGEKGTDGFHRSWIPILPEGAYDHPQWGTLDFSEETLQQIKENFDAGARGIEIALDYDHKASEGDSKAPGWIEKLDFGENIGKGDSPQMRQGLWAYVRWTRIGLADIKDQIYRYVSAEVKPEYHNDITGKEYKNVLVGATLTNRPFMKNMPGIELAEVSNKSWASVNKSKLPRSCFLIKGDASDKSTWKLPIYEGTGPTDADGHYTQRGALNINAVRAALSAIGGARSGSPMSVPAGTVSRLQNLLKRYGGGGDSSSQKASESGVEASMTRIKTAQRDGRDLTEQELLTEFLADRAGQRGDVMLSSTAQAAKAKMSAAARTLSRSAKNAEIGDDDDGEDGDDADGDTPTGNPGASRANHQGTNNQRMASKGRSSAKKLAAPKDDSDDQEDDGGSEGEYAEDDNWGDQNEDGDDSSQDGKAPGALKRAKKSTRFQAELADGEDDTEEMDEGANMDGIDEELDADDDDSEALDKYMPDAPLTGPKAVTGRATAPLGGAGKHNNLTTAESGDGALTLEEARTLREELAAYKFRDFENRVGKQIAAFSKLNVRLSESQAKTAAGQALAEQQVAISKRFREQYRKFMLSDGYKLSESTTEAITSLIKSALEVAIVDLSRKGSSFDMEERKTIRASDAKNGSAQDQKLVDQAEMIAQRDYHVSLSELRTLVREGDAQARDQMGMVYRRAAKESNYQGH